MELDTLDEPGVLLEGVLAAVLAELVDEDRLGLALGAHGRKVVSLAVPGDKRDLVVVLKDEPNPLVVVHIQGPLPLQRDVPFGSTSSKPTADQQVCRGNNVVIGHLRVDDENFTTTTQEERRNEKENKNQQRPANQQNKK